MHLHRTRHGLATKRRTRGQSLVEFALVLPVFLLLIFGIVDLGRLVYMNSTVSQAAREAARVASVEASWIGKSDPNCNQPGGPVCPANLAAFKADVLAAANREMAPFGSIAAADLFINCTVPPTQPTPVTTLNCTPNADKSNMASTALVGIKTVTNFRPITPIISSIVSSATTTGSATMVIN